MSAHLKELMEDCEHFGWPMVRAYHAVWLQHIDQGRATWDNEATHLKLLQIPGLAQAGPQFSDQLYPC